MYTRALVRRPGRNFAEGITGAGLGKPDIAKALNQHDSYCDALKRCGLELVILEADDRFPDGCFVEDTAVIAGEGAVIANPGAPSRKGEEVEISKVLSPFMKLEKIKPPGTLDGGDVLRVENHYYIGLSGRTNKEGADQLSRLLSRLGYTSSTVGIGSGLHLKSGIAYLGDGCFISVPELSKINDEGNFILLEEEESYSANCLQVNDYILIPKGFPRAKEKLVKHGFNIIEIDVSEFRKMDGGLTCLSLLF